MGDFIMKKESTELSKAWKELLYQLKVSGFYGALFYVWLGAMIISIALRLNGNLK